MKKRTAKGLLALLVVLPLLLVLLSACTHTGVDAGDYDAIYTRELPAFQFANGQFRILQLTDLHLFGNNSVKDRLTLDNMQKTVEELSPDLVVITGDAVDGVNKKTKYNKAAALRRMAEALEKTGIYWAYVPGNNDGEYLGDNRAVIAFLMQYPHCVVGNAQGVDGAINCAVYINATGGTTPKQRLIFMDSGCKTDGEIHGFYPSQETWVKDTLDGIPDVETAVFFHIPTAQFAAAWEGGMFAAGYPQRNRFPSYTISETSAGMGQLLHDREEVGLISVGHVHSNNYAAYYNRKFYHFGLCSGYAASKKIGDKTGATLITVFERGTGENRYFFRAYAY